MKRVQMFVGTGIGDYWKTLLAIPENLIIDQNKAEFVISSALLANGIQGFTLECGTGFWNGKPEKSLIITVYTDLIRIPKWYDIANKIGIELYQDCIMMDFDGSVSFIDSTEVAR